MTVSVIAQNTTTGGRLRAAPNGDASAGDIAWETGSVGASGNFTVPLNGDGTITIETETATDVVISLTGYWKLPTGNDTGLGLELLDAPERLVDTTTATGLCNDDPCDTLAANESVQIPVAGPLDLDADIAAVMVAVSVIDPVATGLVGIGPDGVDYPGLVLFDAGQNVSASMIVPVDPATGTITVTSWAATDLAIDVIGSFTRPTRTWRYHYDTSGLRTAKELETADGTGIEWRQEHTWTATGGLPLLLAEHQGTDTTYVIYGPGGTPIYQINHTGEVIYLHQGHQGSVRLVTNANGTTRGAITYDAHGQITANTNPWYLQQPLLGYTGQYHDTETGYIYLRARHYDPTSGQFTSLDPLVAITEEPYGYVGGNSANRTDPLGLYWGEGFVNGVVEVATHGHADCLDVFDADCNSFVEQHPEGAQQVADSAGGYLQAATLGLGKKMFDDEVRWDSPHARAGSALGAVMLAPLAIGSPAVWGHYAAASGAISCMVAISQGQGLSGDCGAAAAMFMMGSYFQSFSKLLPWWAPAGIENIIAGFLAWFVDCADYLP